MKLTGKLLNFCMAIYTRHAIKRMRERDISKSDIEKVIRNPDNIRRDNNRIIANKKINEKTLEIISVKEDEKTIILTCYFL